MSDDSLRSDLFALADLVTPMAIRVAASLRLADHILAGVTTIPSLAERTSCDPDALDRVVRHLVGLDVFTDDGDGTYGLGTRGRMLLSEHPARARDWLDVRGAVGRADLALFRLLDTVTTGQAGYPMVYGRTFWEDLASDPALSASFDALMGMHVHTDGAEVADAYDWRSVGHVIDVGGGNGTLLAAILSRYSHLRGTLVDLPGPAAAAGANLAEQGLANRCEVIVRSFFEPLPVGGDVYVLCGVLHDWNDADAGAILGRCATAAGDRGAVVVIERLLERETTAAGTVMDIRMLAYMSGRERTLAQFEALGANAGLRVINLKPVSYRNLIELKHGT